MCSALSSFQARAQALKKSADAYRGLSYEQCVDEAENALREPGSVAERTDAFMYLGLCQAALAQSEDARDAFISMLAITPEKALPPGLSPRFTSTYLEAKGEWLGKTPMKMEVNEISAEKGIQKVMVLFDDLASLGTKIAWRMGDEETELSTPLRLAPKMELRLPLGEVQIVVLDDRQGEVFVTTYGKKTESTQAREQPSVPTLEPVVPAVPVAENPEEAGGAWVWGAAIGGAILVSGGVVAGVILWPRSATLTPGVAIAPPL